MRRHHSSGAARRSFVPLVAGLIASLSSPRADAQPATVAPPRFPTTGIASLSIHATSSIHRPDGDETMMSGTVRFDGQRRARWGPIEMRGRAVLQLGASYRDDSIVMNRLRVAENEILFEGMIILPMSWRIDPYLHGSIRSAVTTSYRYGRGEPVAVAGFTDPLKTSESIGGSYGFVDSASFGALRMGIALEQTRASEHRAATDDPTTPEVVESYAACSGIELAGEATLRIDSSAYYRGSLQLFGTFDDLTVWSVRSKNEIVFKPLGPLAFTWSIDVVHDVDETLRTQYSGAMLVGVAAEL